MTTTHRHTPGERLLSQHPRPSSNDSHTMPQTLVELMPELQEEPWYRGRWSVLEQRVLTRDVAADGAEAVELIHRPDSSGNLVQSERIVSREWAVGQQAFHIDEIYRRDINNSGSLTRRPATQVETMQTTLPDGGLDTARTVSDRVGDRLQVIERAIERSRPDGRGGLVIEQEVQRSIVEGRFHTVATGRTRESP